MEMEQIVEHLFHIEGLIQGLISKLDTNTTKLGDLEERVRILEKAHNFVELAFRGVVILGVVVTLLKNV